MMQFQFNTNGFEKTKAGLLFLFFGQICSSLIQRASQLFILAVIHWPFYELALVYGTSFKMLVYNEWQYEKYVNYPRNLI